MGGFVLQKLDGDVAKWGVGQISRDVGEVACPEPGFASLQFQGNGRLAFNLV